MPKNFYTLLIVPKEKSAVKKVGLSTALINGICAFLGVLVLFLMYFSYDYIHIKRDKAELEFLKKQTVEQKAEIENLVAKIDNFANRMQELQQFDRKIRIMANLEKNRDKQQLLGIGGPIGGDDRLKSKLDIGDRELIASMHSEVGKLNEQASKQKGSFKELLDFLKEQKSILATTPSIWPVGGWVTSEFGHRSSPFGGEKELHRGIDVATRLGAKVLAPADGIVADVSYHSDMGNEVRIDHGRGIITYYGHLSRHAVSQGAAVKRGDVIGYVGSTGRSTGPHLHYTVSLHGVPVNPRRYLH
ncbi:MAG: peptidoglycan DD-metalloendopeptidase family protein [Deltaproteobacteria bacterium]|nr:peptidoglycan DD-metalloendopeptidase family protein [Deltaproteobacteria bacterium]